MAKKNQFHVLSNTQAAAKRAGRPVPCDRHKHLSLSQGDKAILEGRVRRVDGLYVEIAALATGYDNPELCFTPPEPMPASAFYSREGASVGFSTRQQVRAGS